MAQMFEPVDRTLIIIIEVIKSDSCAQYCDAVFFFFLFF